MLDLVPILAQEAEPTATGTGFTWVFLILVVGAFYLFAIRPQRRRMAAMESMRSRLEVGDEVRTAGGIIGTLTRVSDTEVELDVGGTVLRIDKRAIAATLGEPEE